MDVHYCNTTLERMPIRNVVLVPMNV